MAGFGEGHFQAKDWLGSYGLRVPFPPIEFVVHVSGFMVFLGTVVRWVTLTWILLMQQQG